MCFYIKIPFEDFTLFSFIFLILYFIILHFTMLYSFTPLHSILLYFINLHCITLYMYMFCFLLFSKCKYIYIYSLSWMLSVIHHFFYWLIFCTIYRIIPLSFAIKYVKLICFFILWNYMILLFSFCCIYFSILSCILIICIFI